MGCEGPWAGQMKPATFNKLIIGKDPVSVDSVSTNIMGLNPMAADFSAPYTNSLNYLKLASENGLGEYNLNNIETIDYTTGINREVSNFAQLNQNYPNPFSTSTTISFVLPENSKIQLSIYDLHGHKIAGLVDREMNAGTHEVVWNGQNFAGGIYTVGLKTKSDFLTKKMTLTK